MPEGRRLTFCSDACVHEHRIRTDPAYAAKLVYERDHGVCRACGRDCVTLPDELRAARRREGKERNGFFAYQADVRLLDRDRAQYPNWHAMCDELGLSMARRFSLDRRLWEVDHIVEVVNGGADCGLDNLQTLCWKCHSAKTARLNRERARARMDNRNES
jgi:5-methylcytosine-specific restriction endonuclease McrA